MLDDRIDVPDDVIDQQQAWIELNAQPSASRRCSSADNLATGDARLAPSAGNVRHICMAVRGPGRAATVRCSSTLSEGKSCQLCGTYPMPSAALSNGRRRVMSRFAKLIVPAVTGIVPMIAFSNVNFPVGLRLITAIASPRRTVSSTSRRTGAPSPSARRAEISSTANSSCCCASGRYLLRCASER